MPYAAVTALVVVGALTILPAAQRAPGATRVEPAVPFVVGETLRYDVSWSSFLVAGSATVSVQEKKSSPDVPAYAIVAEGRPIPLVARLYPLYYKMESLFDAGSLLSERSSLYAEEGKERRTATTRFDRAAKRVVFDEQSGTTMKNDYAVPADAQDGLSALYLLRTRPIKAGDRVTIPVADSGGLYRVQLDASAPEHVKVPFGDLEAWTLRGVIVDKDGQAIWKNIAVWISTDARRLPVKLEAELPVGSFVLALRDAQ